MGRSGPNHRFDRIDASVRAQIPIEQAKTAIATVAATIARMPATPDTGKTQITRHQ
jgi:hypothetical protein